jgi:hypothetical protein
MKKAKIVLSAVALFALVGGALAFKARQATVLYFRNPSGVNPLACTVTSSFRTTDPALGISYLGTYYASTKTTANCITVPVYSAQ